jgi:protein-tyrosine phosphatase
MRPTCSIHGTASAGPAWNTSDAQHSAVTYSTPRVLFVCTANIVRSPIAAALLQVRLRDRGVDAAVESAGLLDSLRAIDNGAVFALESYGVDFRAHRSHRLDESMVRHATLILGLEREHVREAVLLDSAAWPRTFTLKEVVRRGEATGTRAQGESIENWIARTHGDRMHQELLGANPIDDIADPYGGPPGGYEDAAEEIDDLVARLVQLVWPQRAVQQPR